MARQTVLTPTSHATRCADHQYHDHCRVCDCKVVPGGVVCIPCRMTQLYGPYVHGVTPITRPPRIP
jgi:hypothetical protein